ncbi:MULTISPECIES: YncE family protein [unclassified Streptomyces]|uniref:YncE family protein n=1 Tax=unclassified Streptomyces TaxID=2593676 RepID=UPI001656730D|nr:YncE family protein [Streptomyces sp. CB02980]MCB8904097.1 YncE family protein [Streptomyces sp. CB02980]
MRTALLTTAAVLALAGTAAVVPAATTAAAPAPLHENLRTLTPLGAALDAEVDPAADRLYVSSSDGTAHRLTVYDTTTGAPVGEPVELPAPATVMALGAAGTLYLGLSTRIAVYDTATRTVTDDRLPVEGSVSLLAADPGQGRLYVGNQAARSVTVHDTGNGAVVGTPVVLPFHPAGLAVDTTSHTGYATYVGGAVENGSVVYRNILNAVDGTTGRLTGTVSLGTTALGSMGVTVDPAGRTGYVANLAAGTVSVVDLAALEVTGTLTVDGNPKALAYDPGTTTLYAARTGASSVAVVDPKAGTVTETITTGERPAALALDPAEHTLYTVAGGAVTQTVRKTPTPTEPTPTQGPTDPTPTGPTSTAPTPTPTPTDPTSTGPTPTATTPTTEPPTQEPTAPAPTRTDASPTSTAPAPEPTPTDSTSPDGTTGSTTGGGGGGTGSDAGGTGPGTPDGTGPTGGLAATGGGSTLPVALTAASLAALGGAALILTRRRAAQEGTGGTTP